MLRAALLENQPDSPAQDAPARQHLIDMVAHDLANGLAGIRLSAGAYLRRRDRSDAETTRYVRTLLKETEQMVRLSFRISATCGRWSWVASLSKWPPPSRRWL